MRLDILVNNVGAVDPRLGGFLSVTDEEWLASLNLNLMAAVRTTRAALPALLKRGKGSIVTISSVNSFLPDPGIIDYTAAKAALTNFSKALSKEVGPQGIRMNTVSPGPVETPLWLGPQGVAATVAKATGVDIDTARKQIVESGRLRHRPLHAAGRSRRSRAAAGERPCRERDRIGLRHRRRLDQDPLKFGITPLGACRRWFRRRGARRPSTGRGGPEDVTCPIR